MAEERKFGKRPNTQRLIKETQELKETTGYHYVSVVILRSGKKCYKTEYKESIYFDEPKDAARHIDIQFIKEGKNPINGTLKRKS
jgi:hypothetical protein